jgi:hypothetical protein
MRICLVTLMLLVAGCSRDFHDGVGPRVPIPNVEGGVLRQGVGAASLRVEVRDIATHDVLASDRTDALGLYGLGVVPVGHWEIKVSGAVPGDFDSETREFDVTDSLRSARLEPFDISARGASPTEPEADAHVPVPTLGQPLTFQWTPPGTAILTARVQLYDSTGADVWISVQTDQDQILWNGIGNQSSYQGQPVPAGRYDWRVKFLLPDSTEARTTSHRLVLE